MKILFRDLEKIKTFLKFFRGKKLSRGKELPRIWQSLKSFQIFLYNASKKFFAKCLKMLKFTEGLKLCDLEMPAQARKKSKIAPCLLGEL